MATKRRSSHRTQWAAQFAAASELCKRGYEVALTLGNHPNADIMVRSPSNFPFSVDVKGLYKQNFWAVSSKAQQPSLFYIFAFVPDDAINRFFVLTQEDVNREIADEIERARKRATKRGSLVDKSNVFPGIPWNYAKNFEDRWDILPA